MEPEPTYGSVLRELGYSPALLPFMLVLAGCVVALIGLSGGRMVSTIIGRRQAGHEWD